MRKGYDYRAFSQCIPDEQLQMYLTKKEYTAFCKWMRGQTCPIGGVYWGDLDRWLKGLPVID